MFISKYVCIFVYNKLTLQNKTLYKQRKNEFHNILHSFRFLIFDDVDVNLALLFFELQKKRKQFLNR